MALSLHVYFNTSNGETGASALKSPFLEIDEPYIVEEPSMRILTEPSDFLREHYVESGKRSSPNTWRAAGYAVKTWLEFLAAQEIPWEAADVEDLKRFRNAHRSAISPQTGEPYSPVTIKARMQTVIGFYRFAAKKGWYEGTLLADVNVDAFSGSTDKDALAHTRNGKRLTRSSELNDLLPRSSKSPPNPFTIPDWRRLTAVLGPMPSEQDAARPRPCRNRLIVEVAVWTGLRLREVRGLLIYAFLSMVPDPEAPGAYQGLIVSKSSAKGKKQRLIRIPNWLVEEINLYIEGERADCLKNGKRPAPAHLFVSGHGKRWSGQVIGNRRIEQVLEEAVVEAGLLVSKNKLDSKTGQFVDVELPKYSYHDLRHTYAVWTYWIERQRGNTEPWKHIQAQLGHKHLQTTIDTYLHYVEIFDGFEKPIDVREILGL